MSATKETIEQVLELLLWQEHGQGDAPMTCDVVRALRQALESESVKLEEIEQYRMQMAGISTAALGYWKEGDSIHPDYDTPALHDVAKLYADYARLFAELVDMVITYPKFTTWSNNEGDSWYEDPADAQIIYDAFGDDPKVGDTFTLKASGNCVNVTYKITEVSADGECEVDCISHPHEHIPPATYCPPGWKLVPVEPTNDMLTAWFRCDRWSRDGSWQEAYRDMLTAAPDVPMQQPNGMVLVPKRMTAAMRHVTDQEGWTWEDLLASAEAITESEYIHLNTGRPQSQ